MNSNKRHYMDGCFCANWVDVDVTESSEPQKEQVSYRRKDLQTLLDELEEIKRNIELVNEKKIVLENLMKFNHGELAEG